MTSSRMLNRILNQSGIALNSWQISKLYEYDCLLQQKNRETNLISQSSFPEIIRKHYVDSLLTMPILRAHKIDLTEIIDLGSGAGLPGIPLAIAYPEISFWLLEKRKLRIAFLQKVVHDLQLKNIHGVIAKNLRSDCTMDCLPKNNNNKSTWQFPAIIARAVGNMKDILELLRSHLTVDGYVVCMKGPNCLEELNECIAQIDDYVLRLNYAYQLPLAANPQDDHRYLIVWQKKSVSRSQLSSCL